VVSFLKLILVIICGKIGIYYYIHHIFNQVAQLIHILSITLFTFTCGFLVICLFIGLPDGCVLPTHTFIGLPICCILPIHSFIGLGIGWTLPAQGVCCHLIVFNLISSSCFCFCCGVNVGEMASFANDITFGTSIIGGCSNGSCHTIVSLHFESAQIIGDGILNSIHSALPNSSGSASNHFQIAPPNSSGSASNHSQIADLIQSAIIFHLLASALI
jgi:hypothetical protein